MQKVDRPKIKFVPETQMSGGAKLEAPQAAPKFVVPTSGANTEKPRLPFFVGNTVLLGPSGAGKSVVIANILMNAPASEVHLFVPTADFDEDFAYEDILKKRKIPFEQHDIDDFEAVLATLQAPVNKRDKKKGKPLLIFDDPGTSLQTPLFANFVKYSRKITSGVIIAIQSYNQIKPEIWKQMRRVCLFSNLSEQEVGLVLDRVSLSVPREDIEKLIASHKGKFQFITIDLIRDEVYVRFG
jgi:hypothetical protein